MQRAKPCIHQEHQFQRYQPNLANSICITNGDRCTISKFSIINARRNEDGATTGGIWGHHDRISRRRD
jgi:hypothetical protein